MTVAGVVLSSSAESLACGGCFSPPPMVSGGGGSTNIQTVTDHRMVLSVSSTQTTLWDQFSYSGNPSEFAWILPIRSGPDVRVEIASDAFMERVAQVGVVRVEAPTTPTRRCGQCVPASAFPQCASRTGGFGGGPRDASTQSIDAASAPYDAGSPSDTGVTVLREQVVGPYAVATLRGTDAGSLRAWLTTNGYAIPASIEPTLMHYISRNMDFVALRLRGGEGIRRMAPIRVVMPGSQPVLPLRMVAAGISDKVGLLLTVIAESRMEAQNFANFTVASDDLVWDFAAQRDAISIYRETVRAKERALGAAWQTESTTSIERTSAQWAFRAPFSEGMIDDAGVGVRDVDVALLGMTAPTLVLTRMRAELSGPQLDRDLALAASAGGEVSNTVQFNTIRNAPTPAACAPLNCGATDGRFETDGTIYGPYSERLAPNTIIPAVYRPGSLPDHQPVERTVIPAQCGGPSNTANNGPIVAQNGSIIARPSSAPMRCAVTTPAHTPPWSSLGAIASGLALVAALRRARKQ
ncbi:MAG: DUF2330 domain-containing protein [Polyangiales bacterium]